GMPLGRKHLRRSRDAPTLWDGPSKNYLYSAEEVTGSQMSMDVVAGHRRLAVSSQKTHSALL
ncbi:MAG: hypothetical protein ACHP78_19835, partial [Terriglobales bacterium]